MSGLGRGLDQIMADLSRIDRPLVEMDTDTLIEHAESMTAVRGTRVAPASRVEYNALRTIAWELRDRGDTDVVAALWWDHRHGRRGVWSAS